MKRTKCRHCGKPFERSRPDQNSENYCSALCRWSSKVNLPADVEECWNWVGTFAKSGYGVLRIDKKTRTAHRVSYEFNVGDIPKGMYILHSCDNRQCVNPLHLRCGTQAENNLDQIERKRHAWFRWTDEEKRQWVKKIVSGQRR